jgi:HD-like signal output (HDOD) protein
MQKYHQASTVLRSALFWNISQRVAIIITVLLQSLGRTKEAWTIQKVALRYNKELKNTLFINITPLET